MTEEANEVKKGAWVPHTPGGSPMTRLARGSEASAWRALMHYHESRVHYSGRTAFEDRGFTVRWDKDFIMEPKIHGEPI